MARNFLGIVGVMLALVALYLVLEHATGAAGLLGALAAGGMAIFGTLQGRTVNAYSEQISS